MAFLDSGKCCLPVINQKRPRSLQGMNALVLIVAYGSLTTKIEGAMQ